MKSSGCILVSWDFSNLQLRKDDVGFYVKVPDLF